MKTLSAKDAQYGFGRLIDLAQPNRWRSPSIGDGLWW